MTKNDLYSYSTPKKISFVEEINVSDISKSSKIGEPTAIRSVIIHPASKSKILNYLLEKAKEFEPREKLNRVKHLDENQLKVFQNIKEKFQNRANAKTPWVLDENAICRFLMARNFDFKKTEEMISNFLDWRFENNVDNLSVEDFSEYDQFLLDLAIVIGSDKLGHPVIYVRSRNYLPRKIAFERFKNCVVSLVEAIVKMLPDHTDQYVIICDTRDFSSENVNISHLRWYLKVFQDYYPNRLFSVYVLHTLTFIQMLWQGLKVFVHPITRDKMNFLGSKPKQIYDALVKHMDPKVIPVEYGGSCEINI